MDDDQPSELRDCETARPCITITHHHHPSPSPASSSPSDIMYDPGFQGRDLRPPLRQSATRAGFGFGFGFGFVFVFVFCLDRLLLVGSRAVSAGPTEDSRKYAGAVCSPVWALLL